MNNDIFLLDDTFCQLEQYWVFVDTNFLSVLFESASLLETLLINTSVSPLIVDPLVRLEFLRDVYEIAQRKDKETFLSQKIFVQAKNHSDIFTNIQDNALEISRIYASVSPKISRPDTIDLLLNARVFTYSPKSLLITSNKKHFSGFLFDTISSLVFHSGRRPELCFYLLKPNQQKFNYFKTKVL